jgi:hypothetical protein
MNKKEHVKMVYIAHELNMHIIVVTKRFGCVVY